MRLTANDKQEGKRIADWSKREALGWARITAFGTGDFACNLYWQSISLYLLFYYTDAVGLSAATAGLIYMAELRQAEA